MTEDRSIVRVTDCDLGHFFHDLEWIEWRQCEFPRCTHHNRAIVEVTKINNDLQVFKVGDIVHIEDGIDLARDDFLSMVVGADRCIPPDDSLRDG